MRTHSIRRIARSLVTADSFTEIPKASSYEMPIVQQPESVVERTNQGRHTLVECTADHFSSMGEAGWNGELSCTGCILREVYSREELAHRLLRVRLDGLDVLAPARTQPQRRES